MDKTWTSGAIELLDHASGHIPLETAFDKRIAFISIDNAVEIAIKTYLKLPKQFFGTDAPSRKEFDDCNNGFTNYLLLLTKYAEQKLIGIEPGDIEHYHRLRNTLYHDGTGLSVDQKHLDAYFVLAKLLLKRLFNIDFQEVEEHVSLEGVIINWNHIEELIAEITEDGGTFKWEEAMSKGLLTIELINEISDLRKLRNQIVHSKSIDDQQLITAFGKSKSVLQELRKHAEKNRAILSDRNFFFEPSICEIKGKMTFNHFYGPPNYGATKDPEELESVWVLNFETTINIHYERPRKSGFNSSQYNIKRVQLTVGNSKIKLAKYQDKIISVKGKFWEAQTGHHFTSVMMDVMSVEEI